MAYYATNATAMILIISTTAGTSIYCQGVPSSNQTPLKSKCKRKSMPNYQHCSGTKSFPFLMKQPPVDNDDVPFAFQFGNMADDTNEQTPYNNNVDILSIMLLAHDEENVTHGPANTSQYFNIVDPSLQPTSQSLTPYNSVASLPPNYQFQIDLQAILSNHRMDMKLQDEIVGLLQHYSHDKNLTLSMATLSSRSLFMTKLKRTMNTSSLKHEDVVVNLSSGNAATVSVFNLKAMIMSI